MERAWRIPLAGIEIRNLRQVFLVHALVALLFLSLVVMPACNVANFVQQFDQYTSDILPALNAVVAILEFFAVPVPVGLSAKVDADVNAAQVLVSDFANASTSAQPAIRAQITAAENVLSADLNQVFTLASVKDANTQRKVAALVQLIESAVQQGFAFIPQTTSKAAMATLQAQAAGLKPQQFVSSFNAILVAPTGNRGVDNLTPKYRLRSRSVFSRAAKVLTFGLA